MNELPLLLSVRDLSQPPLCLASKRTIFRWISTGEFPPADLAKGAKFRRWRRETVQDWLDSQSSGKGRRK
ncbi:MAG: helix-turn-helix domain-containing protein [Phycisphaerales bacterium]|nr:helix-turn-helix domain-containing protein [Phycisphaerales bacterium]